MCWRGGREAGERRDEENGLVSFFPAGYDSMVVTAVSIAMLILGKSPCRGSLKKGQALQGELPWTPGSNTASARDRGRCGAPHIITSLHLHHEEPQPNPKKHGVRRTTSAWPHRPPMHASHRGGIEDP